MSAAASPRAFPYADVSDSELEKLLARAWSDRIPSETLTERSRALRTTDGSPKDADSVEPFGFGVQYESDGCDYPAWDDYDDGDSDDRGQDVPLRFATAEAARTWCEVTAEQEHRTRHRRWRSQRDRWVPRKELYDRRVQALKDAGLWIQEGERMAPLRVSAGPGREPQRAAGAPRYRIVADAQMHTPVLGWWLEDR